MDLNKNPAIFHPNNFNLSVFNCDIATQLNAEKTIGHNIPRIETDAISMWPVIYETIDILKEKTATVA